jgi:hypothetical protein
VLHILARARSELHIFRCSVLVHCPIRKSEGTEIIFYTYYIIRSRIGQSVQRTCYGLENRGSIYRQVQDIFLFFIALRLTQSPIQWSLGSYRRGQSSRGVKLTNQLHIVSRSRIVELYLHSSISLHSIVPNNLSKAIPVTGHGGPWGCETLRAPYYLDSWVTDGGKVVSLTRRPPFTPQEDSW